MSAYGEPQFEVSFSPTKALALEAEGASLFNWGNALLLTAGVLSLYQAGKRWYDIIQWKNLGFDEYAAQAIPWVVLMSALCVAVLVCLVFSPAMYARRFMIQVREMYGTPDKLIMVYRFYDDAIRTESTSGAKMEVKYGQIVRVKETEHLILFRRRGKMMDMLDKTKFIRGDLLGLRASLQEKIPDGKFSWR